MGVGELVGPVTQNLGVFGCADAGKHHTFIHARAMGGRAYPEF